MTPTPDDALLALLQKGLGHELPNRLIAIQGCVQLLEMEERERLSPDGLDYLRRLTAATQRSAALIKAMAEVVRNARVPEVVEKFALPDLLREAVGEVKQVVREVRFEYDFPESGPWLCLSRAACRRAAVHLLRNACQAADPARPLCVEVGAREDPAVVEFWVRDNGRGIPPAQQARLFEPFASRDPGTGLGLGLALVQLAVAGWGGGVRVDTLPGQGSLFSVALPKGTG